MNSIMQNLNGNSYYHYNDYYFKSVLNERINGVLSFADIPYKVTRPIMTEFSTFGPKINRLDFAGDSQKNGEEICLIIECQSRIPTEEDIERFFQYVSSLRYFKKRKIELYILCTQKVDYTEKEVILNDDSKYVMHIISLKDIKAKDIFINLENKLQNNERITQEDIASLQLIAYTDYDESTFDVLKKARFLLEEITDYIADNQDDNDPIFNFNDKLAIIYLFSVLSENMLNNDERKRYVEETEMLINPRERYYKEQGWEEGRKESRFEIAKMLLEEGVPLEVISKCTELDKEEIINSK